MGDYASQFSLVSSYAQKQHLLSSVINQENEYRKLFAQDRTNPTLDDPNLMMIPIFAQKNNQMFQYSEQFPEEKDLPRVMPLDERKPGHNIAIVPKKEFEKNFDLFTEGSLRFLNWDNVFCAGGSVLASLTPVPDKFSKRNQLRREYFHEKAYPASDIDLFIYGLDEEQGKEKLTEIYQSVCDAIPYEVIAFRSKHAITLVSQYPHRHIQIILRLYKSPAEVLMGFDVDCCSVGYDGKQVLLMPRAHNAIVSQYNTVDLSRRSPSYEVRLAKYAERGFEVLVPSLTRGKIDPQIFEKPFDKVQGLARLLQIEKLKDPESRIKFREQQRVKKMRNFHFTQKEGLFSQLVNAPTEQDRTMIVAGPQASDYSTVFLPWGKTYTAEIAQKMMYTKDMVLNSAWISGQEGRTHHLHPCFMGGLPQVLKDCCGHCPPLPKDFDPDSPYVYGELKFIVDNPGRQSIGSFHPITEGEWTEGAYLSESQEHLCVCVVRNDIEGVKKALATGTNPSGRDCLGRTPLHLAVLANSIECGLLLVEAGAFLNATIADGRTPLHIACEYGRIQLVDAILKKAKENRQKMESAGKQLKAKKASNVQMMEVDDDEDDEEEEEYSEDEEYSDEDEDEDEEEEKYRKPKKSKSYKVEIKEDDPNSLEMQFDLVDLEKCDFDMLTALHYSILYGHVECVQLLLQAGSIPTHHLVYPSKVMYSPLVLATFSHNIQNGLQIATLLMEAGCKVSTYDHQGNSSLHTACLYGATRFVDHFLKTDPSAVTSINVLNKQKESCLGLAAKIGSLECTKTLILYGARLIISQTDLENWKIAAKAWLSQWQLNSIVITNELNQIKQPLEWAIQSNNVELVSFLIQSGANVNVSRSGRSLLDYLDDVIKSKEDEKRQRYERKLKEQANKKSAKEVEEKRKKDLEQIEKLRKEQEMERKLTYLEYISGKTDQKLDQDLLSSLGEEENEKKAQEIEDAKKRDQIRNLLVERGAQNTSWLQKTSYTPLQSKAKMGKIPNGHAYSKLFEAAWIGNISAIEKMTINAPKGKQLIVNVTNFQGHTPLSIAVLRNHPECVKRIIEISELQYTPVEEKMLKGAEIKINNFELFAGSESSTPFQLVQASKKQFEKGAMEIDPTDVNQEASSMLPKPHILSLTSAADLIKLPIHGIRVSEIAGTRLPWLKNYGYGTNFNILCLAVIRGWTAVVEAIFTAIKNLTHGLGVDDVSSGMKYTEEEKRYMIVQSLIEPKVYGLNDLRLLDWALIWKDIQIAELLIRYGGGGGSWSFLKPEKTKDDDEEEGSDEEMETLGQASYKGLAGQKSMNWGSDISYRSIHPFPIHVVAYYGFKEGLEFILGGRAAECLKEFIEKHAYSCDPKLFLLKKYASNNLEIVTSRLFGITSIDLSGNKNVFHYAAQNDKAETLHILANAANQKGVLAELINGQNPQNKSRRWTPLCYAVTMGRSFAKKKNMIETLLQLGADVLIPDENNWTPFHFVVSLGYKKVLNLFLQHLPSKTLETLFSSSEAHFTPLMLALSLQSEAIVSMLLDSKQQLNALDVVNQNKDSALHIASKSGVVADVKTLIEKGSLLLNQENAVGMTPIDIVMKQIKNDLASGRLDPKAISKNALQCYQLLCYHQAESLGKRVVASSIDVAQAQSAKAEQHIGTSADRISIPSEPIVEEEQTDEADSEF